MARGGEFRRRLLVGSLGAALLALFLFRLSIEDLRGRIAFLRATAAQPLPIRRLEAAETDFDRRCLALMVWGRQHLPVGTRGVALIPDQAIEGRRAYLVVYFFAPLPASVRPSTIPSGWLALVQGDSRPSGWRIVAENPLGALLAPPS